MAFEAETAMMARPRTRSRRIAVWLVSGLALAGMLLALAQLLLPRRSVGIAQGRLGDIPITTFTPPGGGDAAPEVVIAHGFAGSQQLMYPFALTLARNGYRVTTFDFPGHGQSTTPLSGALLEQDRRYRQLSAALDQLVAAAGARGNPVALLGHSMGAEAVVRYAQEQPERISAVVAVSMFYTGVTPSSPRNLLLVTGALERQLRPTGQQIIDAAAGGAAEPGVTYGDLAAGTARRLVYAPGVEHIGVLYSSTSMAEALAWLDQALGRPTPPAPFLDRPAGWLGLLYLSATALFWPLSQLVRAPRPAHPADLGARRLRWGWLLAALLPALLTPLILRLLPVDDLLPILVGGPLAVFFAIYGLLNGVGLLWGRRTEGGEPGTGALRANQELRAGNKGARGTKEHGARDWGLEAIFRSPIADSQPLTANDPSPTTDHRSARADTSVLRSWFFVLAVALLVVGYVFLTFGLPAQVFVLNYFPPSRRLGIFVAVLAAMLPYFLADEALTRLPGRPRGAYALTKLCFMLSLALAILIDGRLFFLTLIAPLFLAYFAVYGWFSGLIYRRTGTLLPGALANAVIFAWSVAAVFPLVG